MIAIATGVVLHIADKDYFQMMLPSETPVELIPSIGDQFCWPQVARHGQRKMVQLKLLETDHPWTVSPCFCARGDLVQDMFCFPSGSLAGVVRFSRARLPGLFVSLALVGRTPRE